MPKLREKDTFLDLSDYGRTFGIFLANLLKNTGVTPIHVTFLFGISGLIAVYCIVQHYYLLASFFILLKSGIDAADGELARIKKTPSYTGRYLDSVFDFILNFLFFMAILYVTNSGLWLTLFSFFCLQLQGTLYNYYYVILRNNSVGGDKTSKIFELKTPAALPGESQKSVNVLFRIYTLLYGVFDSVIYYLDKEAYKIIKFPNWFMTAVSVYGLGFQLLIMAMMTAFGLIEYIIPFFVFFSVFIFLLIGIRKKFFFKM